MVRFMEARDIDEVLSMLAAEYSEMPGPLSALQLNATKLRDVLEQSLGPNDDHILVSDVDDALRGLLWFTVGEFLPWTSDVVAIDEVVYVKPAYRGTYTAASLGKHYTRIAREMGAVAAYLSAGSGICDAQACAFYEALGYKPSSQQTMRIL